MSMWVGCCNFCNTHFFIQFTAFKNLCQVAATVRLNKTKVQLSVGETVKLKVKGTKKKATWSVANKKVLSVTCLEDISKLSEANFRFTSLNLSHNKIQDLTALQNLPEDITFMRHYNWQQKVYSNYFWYEMEDFTQRKKIVPDGLTGLHTKPGPGGTQVLGYFTDGVMDLAYEDLAEYEGVIYFVGQGVIRSDYTGTVYKTTSGTAVYGRNVENVQELTYTGLAAKANSEDTDTYCVKNGYLYVRTGVYMPVSYDETLPETVFYGKYFEKGKYCPDYTGIAESFENGFTYYVENGIVNTQRNETYMEEVDGYLYIYYVKNGVVTGSKKEKL